MTPLNGGSRTRAQQLTQQFGVVGDQIGIGKMNRSRTMFRAGRRQQDRAASGAMSAHVTDTVEQLLPYRTVRGLLQQDARCHLHTTRQSRRNGLVERD
jgi:hypothetical protein